jgi:hypothetical protein
MRNFHITAATADEAARRLKDLEHYADRRDQLIETLDLDALGPNQLYTIFQEQDAIEEAIDWGYLHVEHLARMEALSLELSQPMRLAA